MNLPARIAISVCALAGTLFAGTIDVTSQSTQALQTGDSLQFLISSASYARWATGMGMSPNPGKIDFTFATMPVNAAGQFAVALESVDGTDSAPFPGPVDWSSGFVYSSGYSGPISAVVDSLTLSSSVSQALFSGSEARLVLTYSGPATTIGLDGDTLRQDLSVSLSGGALSMGAMVYSVNFDDGAPTFLRTSESRFSAILATPEPGSIALILLGAALCAAATALRRLHPFRPAA